VLLPHCPEGWPLVNLWQFASSYDPIFGGQNVSAAFNAILRQLGNSGRGLNPAERNRSSLRQRPACAINGCEHAIAP
jgi:hypothetical protein